MKHSFKGNVHRHVAIIMLLLLTTLKAVGQTFTLKGLVTDDEGKPVEFATVACAEQSKVTFTNIKGEYHLTLQTADSVKVSYSMVGYKSRTRTLYKPKGIQTLRILLRTDGELGEVVVTERRRQTDQMEQLDIKDLRSSNRIDFVGGLRGLGELKRRVDSGEMRAALALYPVSMQQIMDIADSGKIMPPKATWFEPKLRSGLVIHKLS